jgi:hypothetical protein
MDMAASNRPAATTTVTTFSGTGWPEVVPTVPPLTLAQWLVNVNEDLTISRFATGVELWRVIGDAERRAAVAGRLEMALWRMARGS